MTRLLVADVASWGWRVRCSAVRRGCRLEVHDLGDRRDVAVGWAGGESHGDLPGVAVVDGHEHRDGPDLGNACSDEWPLVADRRQIERPAADENPARVL